MNTLSIFCLNLLAQTGTQQPPADDNGSKMYWAILLIAVAIILGLVEIFVPSGAILAVIAGCCAVGGVFMMFMVNTTLGLIGAVVVLIGACALFAFGIKVLPDTPIVRWLTLGPLQPDDPANDSSDARAQPNPSGVNIGDTGTAMTDLRPIGTCVINGKRVDCLAGSRSVEKGTPVRVVSVDGMQIKVKAES